MKLEKATATGVTEIARQVKHEISPEQAPADFCALDGKPYHPLLLLWQMLRPEPSTYNKPEWIG